ncbi:Retrotransposable element Tf2 protein [Ceratobasidium sp. AG-Ba]|nr:Retrotransposable element Tf2 protein [Ceratobasidium sp. AG-Ba]
MPATDAVDQQAARAIESRLREAVCQHEQPPVELEWFMALPKRIRRSAQLIEAAQTESWVLLEHVRSEWNRIRCRQKEQEERLAKARTLPRDLECLRAPDPSAWSGLGRCKKRCRTFEAVGRAYQSRQHCTGPTETTPAPSLVTPPSPARAVIDIHNLDSYVHTPRPLREAVEDLVYQVRGRDPYSSPSLSELHSPNPDYIPLPPSPPPCVIQSFSVQNPFFAPEEVYFPAFGCTIDGPVLTAMSYGRISSEPWAPAHTLDDLAASVADAQRHDPGGFGLLADTLFPDGGFDFSSYRVPTKAALDLIEGWKWMMEEYSTKQVPQVNSICCSSPTEGSRLSLWGGACSGVAVPVCVLFLSIAIETSLLPIGVSIGKLEQQAESMSVPAQIPLTKNQKRKKRVLYLKKSEQTASISTMVKGIMDPIPTLVDSGSSKNFLDINFAKNNNIPLTPLVNPRTMIAIDGKELPNKIENKTTLEVEIEGWTFDVTFFVMDLGDTDMILGLDWLQEADPDINWKTLEISWKGRPFTAKAGKEIPAIPEEFMEFIDVFSEELFKKLPEHRSFDCNIDFVEGSDLPKLAKVYPLSPIESRTIKEFIDQELADGKIRPSKSPIASPCFFVKKKDGSLRLVTDYRKINNITIPDQFPMPLQVELVDQVKNAKIYSKLDLRWGFNNIRIKEGDEWKTAFRTAYGIYEDLVMPFGLKNAPAVLQRMMNDIFRHLLGVTVVVYMDDILIFSEKEEDHAEHVKEVLKILRENNLYAKLSKCEFFVKKVIFLGLVITPEGISMEEEKIKAIMEWGAPRKIKEVQAFLGFVNFYRRFIAEFSKIARPLHDLTKKDTKFEWTQECQQAFEEIKKRVSQDPVLIHPNPDKPFILETDASGIAIGAILSQRGEDGYLHPVAYLSKSYNDAQRNYDTANKELLAIVESLKHWRIYLKGTISPVTVFTDHRNLERWKNAETFNRRHARWHMELASFNFEFHYRPGKMSNKPDALSRRHDHEDIPNPQQIMINAERFKGFKANIEIDIISMIREGLSADKSLTTLIASTKKKEDLPPSIRKQYDKYEWKEDLLWYEGRIVIPENKEIRLAILEMHHDNPIAGHQGQARTLELISRRYYWPAMKQQVNRFVETCEICQRSKGHKHYAPQKPLPIPQKPWEDIAYDFIVKLPESQGMDSILIVIDRFSRQAHFIPCLESTNAEGVADLFIKEVWKLHGLPKTTVSDRGPTFNSQFLKALYAKLGINPKFSTAFHPETDGITERTNQWLEGFLRSFCNYRPDDWVQWLPIAEFCHNNQVNSATGKTAFETIYGLHPRWDLVDLEVNAPNAADMADSMQEIWDEVVASMEFYRSKESDPKREYKVGDKVWLVGQNITTRRPSKKLDNKKLGPFVISEKISSHAYRLELPKTMRTHNVFHINLLAPFTEDKDFHRRQARPPPIVTEEGEEEYEVDHVVACEQRKNGLYYQIRWKGYDLIEDTMERAEKIAELPQIMEDLLKRHPKAPLLQLSTKQPISTHKLSKPLFTTMAPIRSNKCAKATTVRYNPRDARVVVNHTPKSVWGKQRVSHKLTWGHGGDRLYSYQDAIRRCDSFIRSADYAKSLDPGLTLDYIPMAERWNCRWLATHTLQCPKRGNLYWVGKGPRPESDRAMQATKLFVIEEWVGSEVEHLVKEVQKVKKMSWYEDYTRTKDRNDRLIKKSINQFSTPHLIKRLEEWENQGKEKAVPKWVENSTEWWFRLSDIEEMKKEWMGSIGDKGQKMAIVARVVEEWCQAPDISKMS